MFAVLSTTYFGDSLLTTKVLLDRRKRKKRREKKGKMKKSGQKVKGNLFELRAEFLFAKGRFGMISFVDPFFPLPSSAVLPSHHGNFFSKTVAPSSSCLTNSLLLILHLLFASSI
jgi:hypothetical protein